VRDRVVFAAQPLRWIEGFTALPNIDKLVKSHFANDIEPFWKKIHPSPGVKNIKLFEGVSPSF